MSLYGEFQFYVIKIGLLIAVRFIKTGSKGISTFILKVCFVNVYIIDVHKIISKDCVNVSHDAFIHLYMMSKKLNFSF